MKPDPHKLIQYLEDHKDIFKIQAIERKLGVADSTLRHAFNRPNVRVTWPQDLSELFMGLIIDMYRAEVFDPDELEERLKFWREHLKS